MQNVKLCDNIHATVQQGNKLFRLKNTHTYSLKLNPIYYKKNPSPLFAEITKDYHTVSVSKL